MMDLNDIKIGFFKYRTLLIITFIVLFASIIVVFVLNNQIVTSNSELISIQEMANQIKSNIAMEKSRINAITIDATQKATGVNEQRFNADTREIQKFCQDVFTWNNYEEYVVANQKYSEYKDGIIGRSLYNNIKTSESFDVLFFPQVVEYKLSDGTSLNYIDVMQLNMVYEKVEPILIGLNGDKYDYLTKVYYTSSNRYKQSSQGVLLLEYSMDSNNKIYNLYGYMLADYKPIN